MTTSPVAEDPHGTPRSRSHLIAVVEVGLFSALMAMHGHFIAEHQLDSRMLRFGVNWAFVLNSGEARLFAANLLVAIPAALLLTDAMLRLQLQRRSLFERIAASPRLFALGCAIFALLIAELVARGFDHAPFTDDERCYVFTAKNLLHGRFTSPRPQPWIFFETGFQFMRAAPNGRWGTIYPPGQPALIAVGLLLHLPHLPQLVCVFFLVWVASRFADELWGRNAAVLTAALMALSPLLLFTGATIHNDVPTALFCLIGIREAWRFRRDEKIRHFVFAGLGFGAAFVCRPADAISLALPALFVAVVRPRVAGSVRRTLLGLAAAGAVALPFLGLLLAWHHDVTGSWLRSPYADFAAGWDAHVFGFGKAVFGLQHTPALAASKGLVTWLRVDQWLFGWPLGILPALVVAFGVGRDAPARYLLACLAVHAGMYFVYTGPSVHSFGSYYHLPEAPLFAMLTARCVLAGGEHLRRLSPRAPAAVVGGLASLTLAGIFIFALPQFSWLARVADGINAPIFLADEEATRGPILLFTRAMQPYYEHGFSSWVFWPPPSRADPEEPVLWATDLGDHNPDAIAAYPSRRPFLLLWEEEGTLPKLVPWTPSLVGGRYPSYPEMEEKARSYPELPQPSMMLWSEETPPILHRHLRKLAAPAPGGR